MEVIEDTKIPNAATVKVVKQDHTLANLIRAYVSFSFSPFPSLLSYSQPPPTSQLLSMPQILFAGYKVPHPLQPYFLIKIQTDGSITPTAILEQACTKLIGTMVALETKFKREFSFKDVDSGVTATDDPYGTGAAGGSGWAQGKDYLDF